MMTNQPMFSAHILISGIPFSSDGAKVGEIDRRPDVFEHFEFDNKTYVVGWIDDSNQTVGVEEIHNFKGNHTKTEVIICPYCGYEERDSWEYPDKGEVDCGRCGRLFAYERHSDYVGGDFSTYTSWKIDQRTINYYEEQRKREQEELAKRCPTCAEHGPGACMKLPDGKTCSDCKHFRRCQGLLSRDGTENTCDWCPTRFRAKEAATE